MAQEKEQERQYGQSTAWEVFLVFLRLGCTSFGGPIAHLGYFRDEFVVRRRWLTERAYADLVALCQFLPGPSSSQVGIAIGLSRTGPLGAIAAWLGFTLPSAIAMVLFALSMVAWTNTLPAGFLHGLKIVAVAVVAQAVWGMARSFCTDWQRIMIMAISAGVLLAWSNPLSQLYVIAAAAVIGQLIFKRPHDADYESLPPFISRRTGAMLLAIFFTLLLCLPLFAEIWPSQAASMFDAFFRAGSLVFGGGHVVLPLLEAAVVPSGWVQNEVFLAGYGAAQAIPGPLFTFAAFLGAVMSTPPNGMSGAVICLVAIFVPSFLLVAGVLPFWEQLRGNRRMQAALRSVNAAVVGLLLAALYDPIWTSAIHQVHDFIWAALAFIALVFWKFPPWSIVLASGVIGSLLG